MVDFKADFKTNFKAGFDAWRKIGLRQQQNEDYAAALVELKQRLKALEDAQQPPAPAATAATNSLVVPPLNCKIRLQHEGKPYPKSSCEACGSPATMWRQCEAAMKATAHPSAAPGSLVERVGNQIPLLPDGRVDDASARAAIREVAAWMRENECGYNAVRWLEQEADRG